MRKAINIILVAVVTWLLTCCISQPDGKLTTPAENFESLWTTLDERYCYFDEKAIDWDSVYAVYKEKVGKIAADNERALFDTLSSMVNILRDGHVNLISPFDVSRYSAFYDAYPRNYNSSVVYNNYLKERMTAGPFVYGIIDSDYGYMSYSSFSDGYSPLNMYYVLSYFFMENKCKGLIIDVRNNTGGSIENALYLASYFFPRDTVAVYLQHKTGKGHNDFSEPEPLMIDRKKHSASFVDVPVVVLTNRLCYSATNLFVCAMKQCKRCKVIGDKTGGGGGIPLGYELPNGWMIRFSSVKMTDTQHKSIEDGIEPDIKQDIVTTGKDDILEKGMEEILSRKSKVEGLKPGMLYIVER